ncbi:MAG: HD domain-containing phosphohydrolase [Candidatus Zixiibacteriota bacterium]
MCPSYDETSAISKVRYLQNTSAVEEQLNKNYAIIYNTAVDIMDVDSLVLFKFDRKKQELYSVKYKLAGLEFRMSINEGVTGWVFRTGKPAIVNNPKDDHRYYPHFDRRFELDTRNLLAVPIKNSSNKPIGVLVFANKKGDFDQEDLELAESLAGHMSITFENAILYEDLILTFESLVNVLAFTIDERHKISSGHSHRVAEYSEKIAQKIGLNQHETGLIWLSAMLHDYGKISIPDKVLRKEGQLDEKEMELMKKHAKSTYDMLNRVYFNEQMSKIPEIAAYHHERIDGKGYPFGLMGDQIPLGAKIIAVADVYDAMTSWREYHDPYSREIAVKELIDGKGTKFDAKVVEAFTDLLESGELDQIEKRATNFHKVNNL